MNNLIPIKSFPYRPDAELAMATLKANEVECQIEGGDFGGARPDLLVGAGGVKLYVKEEDAESVLEILSSNNKEVMTADEKNQSRLKRKRSLGYRVVGWVTLLSIIVPILIGLIMAILSVGD